MKYKSIIINSGLEIIKRALTVETWGNISVRDSESGLVYLTPSAMKYDEITEDDVVVMDIDGNIVEGKRKPTIETGMHLAIYRNRSEINAVIHTHPIYSMVYAVQGRSISQFTDETAQALGGEVLCTNYALPGTDEMAKEVAGALPGTHRACLIHSHGAVCLGRSMSEAFKTATVLEATARVLQLVEATGAKPAGISQENIDYMWDFAQNKYGR